MTLEDFRKSELRRQLAKATCLGNEDDFLVLESQWVHRYGIESLPSLDDLENISLEIPESTIEVEKVSDLNEFNNTNHIEGELRVNKVPSEDLIAEVELNDDEMTSYANSSRLNEEKEDVQEELEINNIDVQEDVQEKLDVNNTDLQEDYINESSFIEYSPPPPLSLNKELRRWLP